MVNGSEPLTNVMLCLKDGPLHMANEQVMYASAMHFTSCKAVGCVIQPSGQ